MNPRAVRLAVRQRNHSAAGIAALVIVRHPARCSRLNVPNAAKILKSPSNLAVTNQYTATIVIAKYGPDNIS